MVINEKLKAQYLAGEIAIRYDYESIYLLREVIEVPTIGAWAYYHINGRSDYPTGLPKVKSIVPIKDFLLPDTEPTKKKELPEKWYIRGSEKLKEFFNGNINGWTGDREGLGYYINDNSHWEGEYISELQGYTEITVEQYKNSIMKAQKEEAQNLGEITLKIGDKVRGFKFSIYHNLGYPSGMCQYEGKIGEVASMGRDRVRLKFPDNRIWAYPLEEAKKHLVTDQPEETKPNVISRKALSEIYPKVCATWKNNIKDLIAGDLFADEFEVTDALIDLAYKEATYANQKEWLNKYFPQPEKMEIRGYISPTTGSVTFYSIDIIPSTNTYNLVYSTPNFDIIEEVMENGNKQLYIGKYNNGRI